MAISLAKAANDVVQNIHSAREKSLCFFCNVPVEGREYVVKQRKPVEIFLKLNPQWLSFGKVFDDNSRLCSQGYCLGAAFENWRLDSFGIKSPRGQRSPRLTFDDATKDHQGENEVASMAQAAANGDIRHRKSMKQKMKRKNCSAKRGHLWHPSP